MNNYLVKKIKDNSYEVVTYNTDGLVLKNDFIYFEVGRLGVRKYVLFNNTQHIVPLSLEDVKLATTIIAVVFKEIK